MYVVFDIGGTKTRIAASRDRKTLVGEPRKIDTPTSFEEGMSVFKDLVKEVCIGEEVDGVAGGIGGSVDDAKKVLVGASRKPALADWRHKPLVDELSKILDAPVFLENDSAAVGMGEATAGAGVGHRLVAYITVSTGVGGALFIDGKISDNAFGFEPGQQIIDVGKSLWKDAASGSLEDLVSGTATAIRFGKKAYEVEDEYVWEDELPQWLAYGLYNTAVHWSPDVIVLGGSMIVGDPAISVPRTAEKLKEMLPEHLIKPEVKIAECGDFGGLYGGLALLRQNLK